MLRRPPHVGQFEPPASRRIRGRAPDARPAPGPAGLPGTDRRMRWAADWQPRLTVRRKAANSAKRSVAPPDIWDIKASNGGSIPAMKFHAHFGEGLEAAAGPTSARHQRGGIALLPSLFPPHGSPVPPLTNAPPVRSCGRPARGLSGPRPPSSPAGRAPFARTNHPNEEHFLPLSEALGTAGGGRLARAAACQHHPRRAADGCLLLPGTPPRASERGKAYHPGLMVKASRSSGFPAACAGAPSTARR